VEFASDRLFVVAIILAFSGQFGDKIFRVWHLLPKKAALYGVAVFAVVCQSPDCAADSASGGCQTCSNSCIMEHRTMRLLAGEPCDLALCARNITVVLLMMMERCRGRVLTLLLCCVTATVSWRFLAAVLYECKTVGDR